MKKSISLKLIKGVLIRFRGLEKDRKINKGGGTFIWHLRVGNCDASNGIFRFCEACNGCCFYFASRLIKNFLVEQFFKLFFHTQLAYVS